MAGHAHSTLEYIHELARGMVEMPLNTEGEGAQDLGPKAWEPNFASYPRDYWSCLFYIEAIIVDYKGRVPIKILSDRLDLRQPLLDPWSAVDRFGDDGLLVWDSIQTFMLTDHGWAVAHAIRRWRAESDNDSDDPRAMAEAALAAWKAARSSRDQKASVETVSEGTTRVILRGFFPGWIAPVVKTLRMFIPGLSFQGAKDMAEDLAKDGPRVILTNIPISEAKRIKAALEDAGAMVILGTEEKSDVVWNGFCNSLGPVLDVLHELFPELEDFEIRKIAVGNQRILFSQIPLEEAQQIYDKLYAAGARCQLR